MNNVILTDCDGVCLDWLNSFYQWATSQGYEVKNDGPYYMSEVLGITPKEAKRLVAYFNDSANIGWMAPYLDSVKYIRKLHEEHGYVFHAITSLSHNPYAQRLRTYNLKNLFGTAFQEFHYLPCGAAKTEILKRYEGSGLFWLEDKAENAAEGIGFGLRSLLISHPYNQGTGLTRVNNWKEIYERITQ